MSLAVDSDMVNKEAERGRDKLPILREVKAT